MSSKSSSFDRLRFVHILVLLPFVLLGCGDGWDAYQDIYNAPPGEPPGQPWEGDEAVWVVLGQTAVKTALEGIVTSDFEGIAGVRLSDLIEKSQITETPEQYRYDFTATDGYNLLAKRDGDIEELPNWENMQNGFFYRSPTDDLEVAWDPAEQPWGSAVSAYNVRSMNGSDSDIPSDGGTIELLTP